MNIQGINPAITAPMQAQAASSTAATGSSSSTNGTNSLSPGNLENTFLNLLVTELQNQDPTQPVDPTEMVSQMVSLNQLDQLISINQTLSSMAGSAPASSGTGSGQAAPSAASGSAANGGSASPASALARPAGLAFQGMPVPGSPILNTTPISGGLMNLYGNIGALAPTFNQFTAAGGR